MSPQPRADEIQSSAGDQKAMTISGKQQARKLNKLCKAKTPSDAAYKSSIWQFPGFLFQDEPQCALLANNLLTTKFTDSAALESSMSREVKLSIFAKNSLSVLFKALLFHQKYYHTRKSNLIQFLQQTTFNETEAKQAKASRFKQHCIDAYVSARRAYLTLTHASIPTVHTTLTGLVDQWIKFLDTHHHHVVHTDDEYVNRKIDWLGLVNSGALMNAGRVVEDHGQPSHNFPRESSASELSDDSDSDGSDDDQVPLIKSEPDSDGRASSTLHDIGGSSTHRFLAIGDTSSQHKRKATSKLEQTFLKRGRASYKPSLSSGTSTDVSASESDSKSDPEPADFDGALADVKASAEKLHNRQLAKLRKMKFRHSSQKKQLADLQKQMTAFTHAHSNQASLSATVKSNSKSLKGLMKDLEQQQKTIEKVKADIEEIAARKSGEPDENVQSNMDKIQARVEAEVKRTWTGAAMELSNTKRGLLKTMDDQSQRINGQNERLDALESRVVEQTSVTDRHEKAILDQGNVGVQQANRVSMIESSVTSRLDEQENRLGALTMRLADQAIHHAQSQIPAIPDFWLSEHGEVNEPSELRGVIASQGKALRVQGKQLGEMIRHMASLKELCKDLARGVKQARAKPETPGSDGFTKVVARLKEIRQLLPAVLEVQPFGMAPVGPSGAGSRAQASEPATLEDVSREVSNLQHFRMTLSPLLARQAMEEASEG